MKKFSAWLEARIEHPEGPKRLGGPERTHFTQLVDVLGTLPVRSVVAAAHYALNLIPDTSPRRDVSDVLGTVRKILEAGGMTRDQADRVAAAEHRLENTGGYYSRADHAAALNLARMAMYFHSKQYNEVRRTAAWTIVYAVMDRPDNEAKVIDYIRHLLPKDKSKLTLDASRVPQLMAILKTPDEQLTQDDMDGIRFMMDDLEVDRDFFDWDDKSIHNKHKILSTLRRELGFTPIYDHAQSTR